jgi:hypothetical protein
MTGQGSINAAVSVRLDRMQPIALGPAAGASRRDILRWLAMAGVGSLVASQRLTAGPAARPAGTAGRIDVHQHTVPPFYTRVMEKEILATGHPLPTWSPTLAIETMEKNGVATGMLSPMTRVVQDSLSDKSERARTLARQNNDYTQ